MVVKRITFNLVNTGFISLVLVGCQKSSGGGRAAKAESENIYRLGSEVYTDANIGLKIVSDFADQVVIAAYRDLEANTHMLSQAIAALKETPSSQNLELAQAAWVNARRPWEKSEGFLFGPVDSFGYDPTLDSWPVNKADLDSLLVQNDDFSPAYMATLAGTLKGFHTIEYMLFGSAKSKVITDFSTKELNFLLALSKDLNMTAQLLRQSWTDGVNGEKPFRTIFATAGSAGNNFYPSVESAIQEIINGMIGICDEVANGKLADPFDNKDPTLVESQFANNSINDFADNLRSIQNVYLSKYTSVAHDSESDSNSDIGGSLSTFVRTKNPELDKKIRAKIAASIAAVEAIPEPFSKTILDDRFVPVIIGAQETIRQLNTILTAELLPLFQ